MNTSGPGSGPESEVERALAVAIELAARAERWTVVEVLARELGERRRVRVAPDVPSLMEARTRRDREG